MKQRKKERSSGSIALSWEEKAGVRRALQNHRHDCSTTKGSVEAGPQKSRSPISPTPAENLVDESSNRTPAIQDMKKIPLPPCGSLPPPPRITFRNAFRRQHDPFLAAYKHCTKTPSLDNNIRVALNSIATKTKLSFSCKTSIDARDDHFLKPSVAPRLPPASNPSFTTHP